MHDWGAVIIKFWVQIDKDTQLERFTERQNTPEKQWKITDEDWRNRDKWDAYQQAVCDMVERTSTGEAPWTLVESDDKRHARVKVLRTLCERLETELERGIPGGKASGLPAGIWGDTHPQRRASDKPHKGSGKGGGKVKGKSKGKKKKARKD